MNKRDEMRMEFNRLIRAILVDENGPTSIVYRTMDNEIVEPTLGVYSAPEPSPDHVIIATGIAGYLERVGRGLVRDYALKARGAGRTWAEVADGLDIDPDIEDKGIEAFRIVAPKPSMRHDPVHAYWRCHSCNLMITDSGPWGGHPDDTEAGHATDCARHQKAICAYSERWED